MQRNYGKGVDDTVFHLGPTGGGIIGGLVWIIVMIVMITKEPVVGIIMGVMYAVNLSIWLYLRHREKK